MMLVGIEFLQSQLASTGFRLKAVFNSKGAIFLPLSEQHRDHKAPGISYADDYEGNALAAILSPGQWEIRNHRDYSEARVMDIMAKLLAMPELQALRSWQVTYRGKSLSPQTGV